MSKLNEGTIKFTENGGTEAAEVKNQDKGMAPIDKAIVRCKDLLGAVKVWYQTPSEAYSTIVGQVMTPKSLVRVNVLTAAVVTMCVCAYQNVVVTGVTTACVGWIVYHAKGVQAPNHGKAKKGGK